MVDQFDFLWREVERREKRSTIESERKRERERVNEEGHRSDQRSWQMAIESFSIKP